MDRTCAECSTAWPHEPAFCGHCGALLDAGALPLRGPGPSPRARPPRWAPVVTVSIVLLVLAGLAPVVRHHVDDPTAVADPGVALASEEARSASNVARAGGDTVCVSVTVREECLVWEVPVAGLDDVRRIADDIYGVTGADLVSVDLDGRQRFHVTLGPHPRILSHDGRGLVVSTDAEIRLVDREGRTRWQSPGRQPVGGTPVHDAVLAVRDTERGRLLGLDVVTGDRRWQAAAPTGATVMAADGVVVVGTTIGDRLELTTVDHDTGLPGRSVTLPATTSLRRVAAAEGDVVVVVAVRDGAGHAVGVDLEVGEAVWSRQLADLDVTPTRAGLVLSTTDDGPVLVDPATGDIVATPPGGLHRDVEAATRPWEAMAVGPTTSGPVVVLRAPITSPTARMVIWRPADDAVAMFPMNRPHGARVEVDQVLVWGGGGVAIRDLQGRLQWSAPLPFAVPASTSPLVLALPTGVIRLDPPP